VTNNKLAKWSVWLGLILLLWPLSVRAQTTPLSDLDALRYIASQPDLIAAFGADAAKGRSHYETWGIKEGRKITFEPLNYTASHPDLMAAFGIDETKAATHYIQWGFKEGRKTTFNPLNYIASQPDLISAFGADAAKGARHYIQNGYAEKRQITFDPARYMASHPDLIQAFAGDETKGAMHYIQWGYKEKRQTTFSDLDALQYVASFADLIQSIGSDVITAIGHYVTSGYNAGRRITFEALAYIASHGDLINAFGTDALAGVKHYLNWGYKEGRQVVFDALGYLSRHTDLQQAFGSDTVAATKHYINWGYKEGRGYSFTVSVSITGAGSVSKTTQYVNPGEKAAFRFLPEKGFFIDSVRGCSGVLNNSTYTTGPINASCVVSVRFERDIPVLVRIPDPVDYYKSLCVTANIFFVIPARLNQDNTSDFIVHYWCQAAGGNGSVLTTPTPDALVALVSQSDGSYKVDNERVFGERIYKLGGAARKYVSGDINGDGRADFAFAMNWEDGRLAKDPLTNATQLSVLLSTGDFGYRAVRLGKPNWNHAVEIVRNETSVDIVTAGFVCCENVQAFRYQIGTFRDVSSEYVTDNSSWASAFRAINDQRTGVAGQVVGVTNRQLAGASGLREIGIQFLERARTGWSVLSEFWQRVDFLVKWISWQRTEGTNTVISIDGLQYFGGSYDEFCVMPALRAGGPRLLLAKLGVAKDKFGRQLVAGGSYDEFEAKPVNMFVFYEIEEGQRIKQISSPIVNEEIESNFNFFDCDKDLNNDNLSDLVAYSYTRPGFAERVAERGKPTIYLNNGNGKLVRADLSGWPGHSAGNELQSTMTDVNGDGIIDLLLYGSATDAGGGVIEIYLMRAPPRL